MSRGLQHKPYGLTHPTWSHPDCFFYDSAEEAQAAAISTYGEGSGHIVVGVVPDHQESEENR